jgi:hypothetical protein
MAKYTVWVKNTAGYAARTEDANSPEEARAAVQAFIDDGLEKHLSLSERMLGMEDFVIVGVQDYDEAQRYTTPAEVEAALGLTAD